MAYRKFVDSLIASLNHELIPITNARTYTLIPINKLQVHLRSSIQDQAKRSILTQLYLNKYDQP